MIGHLPAAVVVTSLLVAGAVPTASDTLKQDVRAIVATGASGVLAETQTQDGHERARYGVADLDSRRPVPWNAYYRIGSDTKTFTATVALQLVGEGRLRLGDSVEKWLPGLVKGHGNDGRRITVKNLLRQTSGLNDYLAELPLVQNLTSNGYRKHRFTSFTPLQLVDLGLRKPPGWLPNAKNPAEETRWGYSNTNYLLVGLIIEKVTGRPWVQEIHERVIQPLRLRHTFTPGTSAYVPQPTATPYSWLPGSTRPTDTSIFAANSGADGGIVSTPQDLATFLRALLGGRLLGPAEMAEMKRTVEAKGWIVAPGTRYGLGIGWRPAEGCDGGIWFHGGTSLGVVSESGVTGDGARSAVAAVFTLRFDDKQEDQDRAAVRLVDRSLCRPG
ncbi:serine hydrolase domain-containing protein [Nonomuraea sp. B5E05]|uniref:serine hydrolase domain-containing protein n=1 Tax=Nonomuraea sp. B5E05 TaxID=3153569 RepID=UPI00326051BF